MRGRLRRWPKGLPGARDGDDDEEEEEEEGEEAAAAGQGRPPFDKRFESGW